MGESRALEPDEWEFWHSWMQAQRLLVNELDRGLQQAHGISKAEFSVLITLHRAPGNQMRVGELAESLGWDKSRVAHLLTRMEKRELLIRTEGASDGRRVGIGLTAEGLRVARSAVVSHGENIRRSFFDTLAPEQAAAIQSWSRQTVGRFDAQDDDRGPA
ncbi:MarR family winged helix-turn-helix transcriptional regulator [Cryptosporangium sp. NPDC051539]|uniref:MarR family winged helix-turn-helix transcriptional regulator n=1 Tax=Cryptosporangium sp. NPDC051539 TaxID=3363962 RepID=UPI00379DD4C5